MAKKKDTKPDKAPKSDKKPTEKGGSAAIINKAIIALNVIAALIVAFQLYGMVKTFSKTDKELFEQGRVITINAKTSELALNDITSEEIELKRQEISKKNGTEVGKKPDEKDSFIGPMPEVKKEDFVGPMPATEQAVDSSKLAAEAPKPLDYKSANLAVIITEIGMQKDALELANTLPKEVTFAYSPYADELPKKVASSLKDGREVLLNLMMQPASFPLKDAGPMSIQVNFDETQNLKRFTLTTGLVGKFTGLLASNDEIVTSKFDKFAPILKKVSEKSLFIGYFRSANNGNIENDAKPLAADVFSVDYLVDDDPAEDAMESILNDIKEELVVKKRRVVIAIRPYPNSIKVLKKWLQDNVGANIQIAPISYFVTNN